jgi:hypothetical protein
MRDILEQHTMIFSNGFSVQKDGQLATLILSPSSKTIEIIIQSDSVMPSMLWKLIWEKMKYLCQENFQGINLDFDYLCPSCVLDLCKSEPIESIPIEKLEKDKSYSKKQLEVIDDNAKRYCMNRHLFSKFQITGDNSNSSFVADSFGKLLCDLKSLLTEEKRVDLALLAGITQPAILEEIRKSSIPLLNELQQMQLLQRQTVFKLIEITASDPSLMDVHLTLIKYQK